MFWYISAVLHFFFSRSTQQGTRNSGHWNDFFNLSFKRRQRARCVMQWFRISILSQKTWHSLPLPRWFTAVPSFIICPLIKIPSWTSYLIYSSMNFLEFLFSVSPSLFLLFSELCVSIFPALVWISFTLNSVAVLFPMLIFISLYSC